MAVRGKVVQLWRSCRELGEQVKRVSEMDEGRAKVDQLWWSCRELSE